VLSPRRALNLPFTAPEIA